MRVTRASGFGDRDATRSAADAWRVLGNREAWAHLLSLQTDSDAACDSLTAGGKACSQPFLLGSFVMRHVPSQRRASKDIHTQETHSHGKCSADCTSEA